MRSLSVVCIVSVFSVGVSLPPYQALAQEPETRGSPEQLIRAVLEIWSQHDADKVDEVFATDAVYEDVALGEVMQGGAEIKTFLKENFSAVPDFKAELTRVFSRDNMVACEWVMSGTHTGNYSDLPATGKAFSVRGASVVVVEGDRIKHWSDYYDLVTFLRQLGVMPGPDPEE